MPIAHYSQSFAYDRRMQLTKDICRCASNLLIYSCLSSAAKWYQRKVDWRNFPMDGAVRCVQLLPNGFLFFWMPVWPRILSYFLLRLLLFMNIGPVLIRICYSFFMKSFCHSLMMLCTAWPFSYISSSISYEYIGKLFQGISITLQTALHSLPLNTAIV